MNKVLLKCRASGLIKPFTICAALTLSAMLGQAQDTVYVTSYTGAAQTGCPQMCDPVGVSTFGASSGEVSAVAGAPARTRTWYGNGNSGTPVSWSITPPLNVPGGIYKIETSHNSGTTSGTSCSQDALVTLSTPDGNLSASCTNTPAFQRRFGGPVWNTIGYVTNNPGVTQPKITFVHTGGTVNNTPDRLYIDAFKFTEVNPCTGVSVDAVVTGPLAQGQNFVKVVQIDAAATNITVYADGFQIGQLTSGIVAGTNTVPTDPLIRGTEIKATQTKNGCTGAIPAAGSIVGGGANPPQVSVFLSCFRSTNYVGPIGTNAASATTNYILKANGLTSGSQSAPTGGEVIIADQCWHTVTFDHAIDSAIFPSSGLSAFGNTDPFCALEGLVFAIDEFDPNTGPYDIYVDQIKNGDVVIEDFEGVQAGTTNRFIAPNATTTPNPVSTYLSSPNSALISQNNAFGGTNALRVQWQYANASTVRWTRVIANATAAKRYPQLDTTKPITIRYLVLPVGETTNKLHFPTVPANQTKTTNETATFTVAAAGEAPFTYQWNYEGAPIDGATDSSYSKSNVQLTDAGTYSVVVTGNGGVGCSSTLSAKLTVTEFVPPPTITYTWNGTTFQLNWSGTFNLQSKTNLSDATWNNVGVSTAPYNVPLTSGATFYRLQTP